MGQDQTITFRVSNEMKQALASHAAMDFRTSSQLITKILGEWLASRESAVVAPIPGQQAAAPVISYGRPRGRPRRPIAQEGVHPWHCLIEPWLSGRDRVTIDEVLEGAMKIDPARAHIGQHNGVANVLAEMGWTEAVERQFGQPDNLAWFRNSPL